MCFSMVYSLTDAEGDTMFGWGPIGNPLQPLCGVPEGRAVISSVHDGRLKLVDVLGVPVSRMVAARVVNALTGKRKSGGHGNRVAVWGRRGKARYFPSLTAAAKALGMTRSDLQWHLHRLKTVAIFHKRLKGA